MEERLRGPGEGGGWFRLIAYLLAACREGNTVSISHTMSLSHEHEGGHILLLLRARATATAATAAPALLRLELLETSLPDLLLVSVYSFFSFLPTFSSSDMLSVAYLI